MQQEGAQGAVNGAGTAYPLTEHTIAAPSTQSATKFASLPAELKARRQWCLAGEDKVPKYLGQGGQLRNAKSNNPATFSDFETVAATAGARGMSFGYVLVEDDPHTIIDIDIKPDTSASEVKRLTAIAQSFNSYTERSRGGLGYHVVVRGKVEKNRRHNCVEIYSRGQFIICTGNHVAGSPTTIEDRQSQLISLVAQMPQSDDAKVYSDGLQRESDDAVIAQAIADPKSNDLFTGRWEKHYQSQSQADLALFKRLARYSYNDAQVVRLFRASQLGQRNKAFRNDYMSLTLNKARAQVLRDREMVEHGSMMAAAIFAADVARKAAVAQGDILTAAQLLALPPPRWIVRHIVPSQGLVAIYGPSGSGKSFLALSLACAIANGEVWFGLPVVSKPVLFIALEGEAGLKTRAEAWSRFHRKSLPIELRYRIKPFQLTNTNEVASLAAALPLGCVIFIDTMNRAAPTADENSSKEMGAIIEGAKSLASLRDGVVVLIAHTGKDQTKGLRGHSSLAAALDGSIEVQRSNNTSRLWRIAKSKDGEDGGEHRFKLHRIDLGFNEDNEPISSCVAIGDENSVSSSLNPRPLNASSALGMETFYKVAKLQPDGSRVTHVYAWRDEFYARSIAVDSAKSRAFHRARSDLTAKGLLTHHNNIYTEVSQPDASQTL